MSQKSGRQNNKFRIFILDSSKTDGSGLSTLLFNTTGLVIDAVLDNQQAGAHYKSAATATIQDIGSSGSTCGTYAAPSASNCRFAPVDATNQPGLYEVQLLDSVLTVGARKLILKVSGPTNCTLTTKEIDLETPSQGVEFVLTANAVTGGTAGDSVGDGVGFRAFGDVGGVVVVEEGSFPGQPRQVTAWNKSTGVFTVSPSFDNAPGNVRITYFPQAPAALGVKKNAAHAAFPFAMTDATVHTPKAGATVTATRSIDGAAFGACANAVVEISAGAYKIDLAAADLNGDNIMLRFTAPGCDDKLISVLTVSP